MVFFPSPGSRSPPPAAPRPSLRKPPAPAAPTAPQQGHPVPAVPWGQGDGAPPLSSTRRAQPGARGAGEGKDEAPPEKAGTSHADASITPSCCQPPRGSPPPHGTAAVPGGCTPHGRTHRRQQLRMLWSIPAGREETSPLWGSLCPFPVPAASSSSSSSSPRRVKASFVPGLSALPAGARPRHHIIMNRCCPKRASAADRRASPRVLP